MNITARRSYGLPPFLWADLTADLCLVPCPFIQLAQRSHHSLGTEATVASSAFCPNECFLNMLAGGLELTWRGPWVSRLASLRRRLMRIARRWRQGDSPPKALYKLTSVVFPSLSSSGPPCPLPAISVHKPFDSLVFLYRFYLSRFLLQRGFFDLQILAYLSRLRSNVISALSLFIHSFHKYLLSKALC